jgi:hypothetical protein
MGSAPPVISTSSARFSDQPAIGKSVRSASFIMFDPLSAQLR